MLTVDIPVDINNTDDEYPHLLEQCRRRQTDALLTWIATTARGSYGQFAEWAKQFEQSVVQFTDHYVGLERSGGAQEDAETDARAFPRALASFRAQARCQHSLGKERPSSALEVDSGHGSRGWTSVCLVPSQLGIFGRHWPLGARRAASARRALLRQ